MQDLAYIFADEDDAGEIKRLLTQCKLPTGGIDPHLKNFIIVKSQSGLVGVIGIEQYGKLGILRSFAVSDESRGHGIGNELFTREIAHARSLGIAELYLLTTTAEGYFLRRSFQNTDRKSVPQALSRSIEFKSACPTSAGCMKFVL